MTNQEWQAALGTPDPGADNGTTDCNSGNTLDVTATGSRSSCKSDAGAVDMVGNVEEWVPRSTACPAAWPFPDYGSDIMCLAGASTTSGPGALLRGGDFLNGANAGVFDVDGGDQPSGSESYIGFRCAR